MRWVKQKTRSTTFWLGFTYLALIPIFAIAYDSLGHDSFYDANAEREKGAYIDAAELRSSLTHALTAHLSDLAWRPLKSNLRVRLNPKKIDVTAIEYTTEKRLLLEISGLYKTPGPSPLLAGVFHFWIEPTLRQPAPTVISPGRPKIRVVPVALSLQAGSAKERPKLQRFSPPVSLVFPSPSGSHLSQTDGSFLMSESTYRKLLEFYLGVTGDPSYASDHLWRLLYLSAVTVTTLGFGDITPVSDRARLLVGAEAVLGVVIIGLFLSALASGVRPRSRS